MSRYRVVTIAFCAALLALTLAAPAGAALKVERLDVEIVDNEGNPATVAAAHPSEVTFDFDFVKTFYPDFGISAVAESVKEIRAEQPLGLLGDPTVLPTCPLSKLLSNDRSDRADCPDGAQMGVSVLQTPSGVYNSNLYNMARRPDELARFGMNVGNVGIYLMPTLRADGDYGLTISSTETSQVFALQSIKTTFWGVPADPSHDGERGKCLKNAGPTGELCPSPEPQRLPFLTNPTSCTAEPVLSWLTVNSWQSPADFDTVIDETDVDGNPLRMSGCNQVPFEASLSVRPTTNRASAPSGLDADLTVEQYEDPDGLGAAHLRSAVVTLPEGMTVNPPSAAGLGSCSPAQVAIGSERPSSCPDAAKIGKATIESPSLDTPVPGEVFVATPHDNPFGSLVALYIVARLPNGQEVKLSGRVDLDPVSGRVKAVFPDNPQLPFSRFHVELKQGPRAPLKTPDACGTFTVASTLTPWSAPEAAVVQDSESFEIVAGPAGDCLPGGASAPHQPAFRAGTLDPTGGAYTPFVFKLSREDGAQPLKAIDTTLPEGLLGKLAGVPYCSDAALAAAAGRDGRAEQASASCPAASQVGSVDVGAGAGSTPLHVAGKAYLTGPYKGAPLSLAIVTPAVAGPFDLGVVVVRTALQVNPETAQIRAVSDPIPTILEGVPLNLRSVSVQLDRPSFTLNPTSCEPMSVDGSATSVFDLGAPLTSPFQVGDCGRLGFKPKLVLRLRGGVKRGDYPALRATLTARPGDANIGRTVVALPRSEFLAQSHIRTICTRVQFAVDACPPGSVYGSARAVTPLLDQPLSGPVYLRASDNKLPDLVAALDGQIEIDLVGRIDSVKGGIRTTFATVPDAPVSKFVLRMLGGKKGLLENSRNICLTQNRVKVQMTAQSGRTMSSRPVLKSVSCGKQGKKGKKQK